MMKIVTKYVDKIADELSGAKDYAECYVEAKINEDTKAAERYKIMANDEIKHAGFIHEMALTKIEAMKRYFEPTAEMLEMWNNIHAEYVETVALVSKTIS